MISQNGENLGVMDTQKALGLAQELELDLVVIAEKAQPPVAKIVDFNKFLYNERKKASGIKSKQSELKELRLSPNISDQDLQQRVERAKEFLQEGNVVRISLAMKGRQILFPQIAQEKIDKFIKLIEPYARVESAPKQVGSVILVTFLRK